MKNNDDSNIKKYFSNVWDNDSKQKIHQMNNDCVNVFEKHNSTLFLFYGSLLGCERNGQIIPWDGDVDFFVDVNNDPVDAFEEFKSMGYKVYGSNKSHRRIYREENLKTRKSWTWPWVDFYIYEKKDDVVNFLIDRNRSFYSSKIDLVFPLKKKKFEGIDVPVPCEIRNHLDIIYPNWDTVYENCKVQHKSLNRIKERVKISIKSFKGIEKNI